jgi:hypothetical protein
VQLLPRGAGEPPFYCKRQTGHTYRTLLHPFARPTVLRELQAYRVFARLGVRTPRLVYGGVRKWQGQWQALLVTEALQDFVSLGQWYADGGSAVLKETVLYHLASTLLICTGPAGSTAAAIPIMFSSRPGKTKAARRRLKSPCSTWKKAAAA